MTLTITGCGNLKNFFLNRLIVVLLVTLGGCSIVKPNPRDKDIDIILYHPNMAVGALQDIAAKDACAPGPGSGLGSLMSTCTLQTGIQFTDVTFSNQNVLKYLGNGVIKAISPGKSKLTVTAKHQYTAVTKTFDIEVFTADRFALKINGQFVQEMPFICNSKTYLAGATYFSDYQLWAGNTELGGYEFYPLTLSNAQTISLRERMSYYAYDKKIYPSDGLSPTVAALPSYQAARDRHKLIFGPDSGLATVVNSITGATILRANVIKPLEITDLNFRSPNVIAGSETHVSVEAVANGIVVCQPSVEFLLYKAEILTQQHCSFSRKKIVTVIHSSDQNIHFSATKSGACQMRVSVENGNLYKNLSITIK